MNYLSRALPWASRVARRLSNSPGLYRLAGSVLASSLLGGFSLGLLNRYALYNYSVSYGARAPLEGVPYLDFAVGILGFAFILVVLLGT